MFLPTLRASSVDDYQHTQKGGIVPYTKFGLDCLVEKLAAGTPVQDALAFDYKELRKLLMALECELWCIYVGTNNTLKWESTDLFTHVTGVLSDACAVCHGPVLKPTLEGVVRATLQSQVQSCINRAVAVDSFFAVCSINNPKLIW